MDNQMDHFPFTATAYVRPAKKFAIHRIILMGKFCRIILRSNSTWLIVSKAREKSIKAQRTNELLSSKCVT
jgi:hypothetical protein